MFIYSIRMPDYAVRITHSYEEAKPIISLWAMRTTKMLVYEHIGGTTNKTHIHVSLLGTNVDKKQLRNIAATTKIPVSGNENMSFKIWDKDEEYIKYMTKGKHDPKYNKGYEEFELLEIKKRWVETRLIDKPDKTDKLLGGFDTYIYDNNVVQPGELMDFWTLRKHVKKFVFVNHPGVRHRMDIKAKNLYHMIMNTYIYENNVKLEAMTKADTILMGKFHW